MMKLILAFAVLMLSALAANAQVRNFPPIGPNANPSSGTGSPTPQIVGPGYAATVWYQPMPGYVSLTVGGAPSVNVTYCTVGWVGNISPSGGGSATLGSLAARITTLGTSNIQLAMYKDDATVAPHRPGTLVGATGNIVDTSTGTVTGAATGTVTGPGQYWLCMQTNDTTVRMISRIGTATDAITFAWAGTATAANALAGANVTGGVSTPGTFGTWPASLNGSTWTEVGNTAPLLAFQFASIP
jgi:hypothetical protein